MQQLSEQDAVHAYPNKYDSDKTERISWEEILEQLHDAGKVVTQMENCVDDYNGSLNWECDCFPSGLNDGDIFFLDQEIYCCYEIVGDTFSSMNNDAYSSIHNSGYVMSSVLFYDDSGYVMSFVLFYNAAL